MQYKEAWKITRTRLTHKPIWAMFAFIIPIFNLLAPYQIMNDLWTVFNKDISIEKNGKDLIKTWWFLSVGLFIFSKYIAGKFSGATNIDDFLQ